MRKHALVALIATVVAVAISAWLAVSCFRVGRENMDRIQEGMTLAEVHASLGGRLLNCLSGEE
jgi:hypothetical protein